ncbi:MAG: methylisocitrate lyase [Trueperaceae bacterium]|nr:methylisocitrate lyase [Trueperaceae bacterium]
MLYAQTSPEAKRKSLMTALQSGHLLRFPGAFSPLVAKLIEEQAWDGIYISGAVLANDLGLPDIGLTSMHEVCQRGHQIARVSKLPALIDIDTGFGEPMNVARTVQELENLGLAGCHLEDQVNPKRCGHLDNKTIISVEEMCRKIKAANDVCRDEHFLLIARTDARASEGLQKAIDRALAYIDAGARMIFPEALESEKEFESFRKAVNVPLLANMTEFGKSKLLSTTELANLGYNLVIYPVTTLRLAMHAVEAGLGVIKAQGTQAAELKNMQTRARLYELLEYEAYNKFDQSIYNFELKDSQ